VNLIQQVQAWYSERQEYLSQVCLRKQIGWSEQDDPDGEIGVGLDAPLFGVSISVFNNGLISTTALDKRSGEHLVLDHRMLAPDEDLAELLDRYVQRLSTPE
jgi:hypothetical protein